VEAGEVLCERYRVTRFVARGGMGEVYEAVDEVLEQTVALKHVSFAGLPDDEASRTRARTLREARLAARLRGHPRVVAVYDVVEADGDVWLVLEYLRSRSLSEVLGADGRLDPVAVARIGSSVADALAAAHEAGVLHRDVKPGNVLLAEDSDVVKLTDFGISRADGDGSGRLTATDVVSGTPSYMAREVARGDEPTAAADVYALGATLYRAVEGHPPFGTDTNALRLMYRVATEPLPPPQRADDLEPLLLRMLEADPATRPDAALARDLLDEYARRPFTPTIDAAAPAVADRVLSAAPAHDAATPVGATTLDGPPAPLDRPAGPGPAGAPPVPAGAPPGPGGAPPVPAWSPGSPGAAGVPGSPAAPDPGPARRPWWRHRAALVALAVVVVLLVAGTITVAVATRTATSPVASAPAPLAMTVPPVQADACSLIDRTALSQYGPVSAVGVGNIPAGCRAVVGLPGGDVRVGLVFGAPGSVLAPGTTTQEGPLTVIRQGPETVPGRGPDCPRTILLTDGTHVLVTLTSRDGQQAPACAMTDTATTNAVTALVAHGVLADPTRAAGFSFASTSACSVLSPADLSRDLGGVASAASPGFANWSCSWSGGTATATLYFEVDGIPPVSFGTPYPNTGDPAQVRAGAHDCQAAVQHRRWFDPAHLAEWDVVELSSSTESGDALCGRAVDLANVASQRTP
jgi:eukaryotic-like serine/threonine-protein kinase